MLRILSVLLAFAIVSLTSPESASAGGYEYPGDGARAMGRGAANLARADDPMTMFINPAGLGSLPGTQFMLSAHTTFFKACIERLDASGNAIPYDPTYTEGGATNIPQEKICNGGGKTSNRLTLVPSLGITFRASKYVGIGIGVHPPNSMQKMIWGTGTGTRTVAGEEQELPGFVDTDNGSLPSPVRYQLVDSDIVVLYPTIAIGVKPVDWLQFGVAFSSGFAQFTVNNYTRSLTGGEDEFNDVPTKFTVKDRFVPRVVASVHLIPHDSLDVVGAFRWDDDVRASGKMKVKSILGEGGGKITYTAPRPMWVSGGIRYGHRIAGRGRPSDASAVSDMSGSVQDHMSNEVFDIEVNVVYERNSTVDNHTFDVSDLSIGDGPAPIEVPDFTVGVPHNWKDQFSIRAGGDWNVLPGVLALRTGFSYENAGFRKGSAYADFFPLERYGLHGGLTFRINRWEVSAAFAHFFQKTFDNGEGTTAQIVNNPFASDPADAVTDGDISNGGKYSGRINIASFAFRHFFP